METLHGCPDVKVLRGFLDDTKISVDSSTWTRDGIEQHVNDCQVCQKSIEQLVAGAESWEGTARQLVELDRLRIDGLNQTSGLRELIEFESDRSAEEFVSGSIGIDTVTSTATPLDFLQPSDQPDSRGRLGSYEVLEVVGQGGMGLVLKAYDPSLRRIVAIKVMASHLASSPVARKRFIREARAAAAISHDHVVSIYAVEESQQPPFLVMQFIIGNTLQVRLAATGPLAINEVLRIGMQTASGLAAAHAQGLVHRDIKPANILLENGVERVKITDFGLARAVDDVGMTRTGIVAGTPQFMAPEQANGEAIDFRSDLFSLGSVLYMLCTGRPPFRATTTMGLLKRICEETPRSIRELNPDVPEWLDAIIAKLLRKNPSERYQTAKEVADLLGNWLAHVQQPMLVPAPALQTESTVTSTHENRITGSAVAFDDSPDQPSTTEIPVIAHSGEQRPQQKLFGKLAVSAPRSKILVSLGIQPMNKKKLISITLVVLFLGVTFGNFYKFKSRSIDTPPNVQNSTFAEAVKRGSAAFERADYDVAVAAWDEAIRLNPNHSEVHRWRGDASLNKHEYDKALSEYDEAIRLDSNNGMAHCSRGTAWTVKRDLDKALASFDEAIRLDPKIAKLPFYKRYRAAAESLRDVPQDSTFAEAAKRGMDAFERADFDQAISAWDEAIRLNPNHSEVHRWRGDAWLNKQEFDKALPEYDDAIRLDSKNGMAFCGRGAVWTEKGDSNKAVAAFDEAIRLAPEIANLPPYKRYREVAESRRTTPQNPKFAETAKRGMDAFERGEFDQAIAAWDEALLLDPDHSEVHRWRGDAWLNKYEYDKALAEYDDAIRLDPNNGMAHFCRGAAWTGKGDSDKAIASFDEAIQLDPKIANLPFYNRFRGVAESLRLVAPLSPKK